jgi:hypothetical protein
MDSVDLMSACMTTRARSYLSTRCREEWRVEAQLSGKEVHRRAQKLMSFANILMLVHDTALTSYETIQSLIIFMKAIHKSFITNKEIVVIK